jgi:hypothetical protein
MKVISIIIALLLSLQILAQNDSLFWGIQISSGYSRSSYRMDSEDETSVLAEELMELETPSYFPNYGILLNRKITGTLSVSTGIQFKTIGYRIDTLDVANMYNIIYRHRLLEIPLGIKYSYRPEKKVYPFIGGAVQLGQIIRSNWTYKRFDSNETFTDRLENEEDKKTLGLAIQAGFSIKLHSKYRFDTQIEYANYSPSSGDSPIVRRYQLIGINLSLSRSF